MANPESDSLANLQKDIEAVKEQGYTYKMCELPEASQVQYFTKMERYGVAGSVYYDQHRRQSRLFYRQYAMVKEMTSGRSMAGQNPSYRAVLRRRRRQSKKRKWYA